MTKRYLQAGDQMTAEGCFELQEDKSWKLLYFYSDAEAWHEGFEVTGESSIPSENKPYIQTN